jgi:alpha-L-fucosidase 2
MKNHLLRWFTALALPLALAAATEQVPRPDGDVDWIETHPDSPFITLRRELRNPSPTPREIRTIEFVRQIPLAGQAATYRTLGVDGLKAADAAAASYLFLAVAKPDASDGTVAGWITQDRGSGSIHSQATPEGLTLTARLEFGRLSLPPGAKVVTDAWVVGRFPDARLGLETYADTIARIHAIKLPKIPNGYCTWYSSPHGGASNEKALAELGAFCARELAPYGFDSILIDDQWQGPAIPKGGLIGTGPTGNFTRHNPQGPYPSGMKATADQLVTNGLRAGIWFTPFSWDPRDPLFQEHQDWFVKKTDGSLYEVLWAGWCLDMTHPDARAFLADAVRRLTGEWGFRYLKPDALWCGLAAKCTYPGTAYVDEQFGDSVFHDPALTGLEAYRAGLRTMRDAAGSDTYIAGCNVAQNFRSMGGAIGLVDAMRIGPDTGADWNAILPNFHLGTRLYFFHNRVWHNDPDCLMLRAPLTLTQARSFASWIAVSGSLNLVSEWLPGLPPDRLEILKRSLPNTGLAARPLDLFTHMPAQVWHLTDRQRHVLGLFNWSASEPATVRVNLTELGFNPAGAPFVGLDYWSGRPVTIRNGVVVAELPPSGCSIIAVAQLLDRPQLLGTSRHITHGFVDVGADQWRDATLAGTCQLVGGDPTELRIATASTRGPWKALHAEVSEADRDAGVRLEMKSEPDLLRVTLTAPTSRPVRWSVRFEAAPLSLWYRRPAQRWLEALPVGNGRLGALLFGDVTTERVALNESTFWSGAPDLTHDNPAARQHLPEIRRLLFDGQYRQAVDLISRHLLGRRGNYGTHLPVGDLLLDLRHPEGEVREYRRDLDLEQAVASVRYAIGDVRYTRELLASHPDNVLVLRLAADRPGHVTFRLRFRPNREPGRVQTHGNDRLLLFADARERQHSDGQTGVSLAGAIQVIPNGGRVTAHEDALDVTDADAVTLLVALNTTFTGGTPAAWSAQQLAAAATFDYPTLHQRHVADYQPLFRRVTLELDPPAPAANPPSAVVQVPSRPSSDPSSSVVVQASSLLSSDPSSPSTDANPRGLPTDERLARLRAGQDDPALVAQFFQYGRYLLLAGSRHDSPLPTNLQGVWNDNLACNMGWTCDFHLDINTQQNYWPAEVANLSECHAPLFRLIESLREPGRRTAATVYGARGWVCHVVTNPWGFTAPGWGLGWGVHPTGGIWIASHLWEHYRFTGDREFLRQRAYPTLREAAEFFLDYLVEHPRHGWLVTGPATSPENAFVTPNGQGACSESMGPTCDTVLVRDLFRSCLEASRTLGEDEAFQARIEAALQRLPPLQIGRHGQLMEWLEDYEEAVPNHRHTTHLIALFPSEQITPRATPALARAARVSLERRLGQPDWEDVEWSRGNLIAFFARLLDGDAAHQHLLGLLREDTDANLLTFSRGGIAGAPENIFVVDGNSAGTAGIAEMLLQSHRDEIELLPALPATWPTGAVKGLRARGGFEVDLAWDRGQLTAGTLHSAPGTKARVRYGHQLVPVQLQPGQSLSLPALLDLRGEVRSKG